MARTRNERRNRQIVVLVDRRKMPAKQVAMLLRLTYQNVRKILSRFRKGRIEVVMRP